MSKRLQFGIVILLSILGLIVAANYYFDLLGDGTPYEQEETLSNNTDLPYDGIADFAEPAAVTSGGQGGYPSKVSVAPGDTLDFHIAAASSNFDLIISRQAPSPEILLTIPNLSSRLRSCTNRYDTGCNWPATASLTIPDDWASGVYFASFTTSSTSNIIFFVREKNPGTDGDILLLSAFSTSNAYTNYGGKSVYEFNSSNGERGHKVSFDRPIRTSEFTRWEKYFLDWGEQNGYNMAVAADYDLHFFPNLLQNYKVAVIAGHSEYWSWPMRQQVKSFIANGGRFINLSGNTMWQQVRFENNGRVMASYKNYNLDSVENPEDTTDNPVDYPILDTEASILGAQWLSGGYIGPFTHANGYGGFAVLKPEHWIMEGVSVGHLEMIGRTNSQDTAVIDKEADGIHFNCGEDGQSILGPVVNAGTPANFNIVGMALSSFRGDVGFIPFGTYTVPGGGAVFSVNTTGWSRALALDPAISTITSNVLNRFLDRNRPIPTEQAGIGTDLLFHDRFNCHNIRNNWPHRNVAEWDTLPVVNYTDYTSEAPFEIDLTCGYRGSGLKIKVLDSLKKGLVSRIHPNWEGTPSLYTAMYIDLDRFTISNNGKVEVMRLIADNLTGGLTNVAWLELKRSGTEYFARFRPSGTELSWVPVPRSGHFLVETYWDKPNDNIALWINGNLVQNNVALGSLPNVNRVDMGFVNISGSIQGNLCIDEFAFDDERVVFDGEPPAQPTATPTSAATAEPTPPPPTATPGPSHTATPLPPSAGSCNGNVITNPDFEDSVALNGWKYYSQNGGSKTVAGPAYHGSQAARLTVDSPSSNIQFYQHNISLEPNIDYQLSFAGYSSNGNDLKVRLLEHDDDYTNYGLQNVPFELGTDWEMHAINFTTPSFGSNVNDGRLMFWLSDDAAAGDVYWVDQVCLTKKDNLTQPPSPTPGTAVQVSPNNVSVDNSPTFTWQPVEDATEYKFVVYDDSNNVIVVSETYSAGELCQADLCTLQIDKLASGSYRWLVQTVVNGVAGDWSTYPSP